MKFCLIGLFSIVVNKILCVCCIVVIKFRCVVWVKGDCINMIMVFICIVVIYSDINYELFLFL